MFYANKPKSLAKAAPKSARGKDGKPAAKKKPAAAKKPGAAKKPAAAKKPTGPVQASARKPTTIARSKSTAAAGTADGAERAAKANAKPVSPSTNRTADQAEREAIAKQGCVSVALVSGREEGGERRASYAGRLQVVPEPRQLTSIELSGTPGTENYASARESFEKLLGYTGGSDASAAEIRKRHDSVRKQMLDRENWESSIKLWYRTTSSAVAATVYVVADFSNGDDRAKQSCSVTGPTGGAVKAAEASPADARSVGRDVHQTGGTTRRAWKFDVEAGALSGGANAAKRTYRVKVKGGDGKERLATVEVLPPATSVIEFELAKSNTGAGGALQRLSDGIRKLGGNASLTFDVGGTLGLLWGWKEATEAGGGYSKADALYVYEASAGFKPLFGAGVTVTISALQAVAGIPPVISDHIGDLRLILGLRGAVSLLGAMQVRQLHGGKSAGTSGSITISGELTFSTELAAHVGSEFIAKIEAKGGAETGIEVSGALSLNGKGAFVDHEGSWTGVKLSYSIEGTAGYFFHQTLGDGEWKLFDAQKLWSGKQITLKQWGNNKAPSKL